MQIEREEVNMVQVIEIIIVVGIFVWIAKGAEWRSSNRSTPSGYHHDYNAANYDITVHGKDYYHQQNLKGRYDVPNKK